MEKKIIRKRILSMICSLSFFVFGANLGPNRFCLGDMILNRLGLPVWSKGTQGLHYPGIIALIGVTVSFYAFASTTKNVKKTMYKLLMGAVVLMVLLSLVV